MASVEELKATVGDGSRAIAACRATLLAAVANVAGAESLLARTAHDSRHDEIVAALRGLTVAKEEVERTVGRLDAAEALANEYLAGLG